MAVEATVYGPSLGLHASTVIWSGDITPPQITGNQNDYDPAGLATAAVLRLDTDASRNITGLAGGVDGRRIKILNVGAQDIVLVDQDAGSVAANRFELDMNYTIGTMTGVDLIYDSTSSRWRFGESAGGGGTGIGGTIAATQVAFGDGADSIAGEAAFTYTSGTNHLNVDNIEVAAGTAGAPSYSFSSASTDGMFRDAGMLGPVITVAGTEVMFFRSVGLQNNVNGDAANPSYSFRNDKNTGFYLTASSSDDIGCTGAGVLRCLIHSGATPGAETGGIQVRNGSVGEPGLSFINDTNSGFYRISSARIAFSLGGSILFQMLSNTISVEKNGTTAAPSFHGANSGAGLLWASNKTLHLSNTNTNMLSIDFSGSTDRMSIYGQTPIVQPSSTGQTAGFTAGVGTAVNDDSTFTGGVGTKAYTIGDVVKHLKEFGNLAES